MKPRRVCLFTGVSGRLGRDFCERYASLYDIVGVYHATLPAVATRDLSAASPGKGIYGIQRDLGAEGSVEELADQVLGRFGSVDLLVNAAVYRRFGPLMGPAGFVESLDWQFYLNTVVPVRLASVLARRAWRHTPDDNRKRRRNVVNLSSTAGNTVYPGRGQSGYAATKAGLDAFTRHMASEWEPIGVRVNGLAPNTFPGLVPTATVSDRLVAFDSGAQTGQILVIDTEGEYLFTGAAVGMG